MVLSCDDVPAQPMPPTGTAVGIDAGVASFLTTGYGGHSRTRGRSRQLPTAWRPAQQALARKKRGSNRRRKTVTRVATIHG